MSYIPLNIIYLCEYISGYFLGMEGIAQKC